MKPAGVITRPLDARTGPDPHPPKRAWCVHRAHTAYYGNSLASLIDAALIPGYTNMNEDTRAVERITLAIGETTLAQAEILAGSTGTPVSAAEEAALCAPKWERTPGVRVWTNPLPLLLLTTSYQPYTNTPPPMAGGEGQIWWIEPEADLELLTSLARIGRIGFYVRDDDNHRA